jgi:hypothetical protein
LSKDDILFYTTSGCHLCETALLMVNSLQEKSTSISIKLIDISSDPLLVEKYGVRIPVLRHFDLGKELGWPFDEDALAKFIKIDD